VPTPQHTDYSTVILPTPVTAEILQRVLYVRYEGSPYDSGSAFTLDTQQHQYIVTATHVVHGIKQEDTIEVFFQGGFRHIPTTVTLADTRTDVTVLRLSSRITPSMPVVADHDGLYLAQDVYFLGFPYSMVNLSYFQADARPFPFVKKGIISQMERGADGKYEFFVDAHNNPGFSGGPLIFRNLSTGQVAVAGVVTDRLTREQPVHEKGRLSPYVTEENIGILLARDIAYAVEALDTGAL